MSSDDIRRHLESATDDVTPPDDLLAGLRRRYTRRVVARRTAAIATPLAIAAAVAVPVAAQSGGTGSVSQAHAPATTRPAVHDVAYVVKHASEALRTEDLIQYTVQASNSDAKNHLAPSRLWRYKDKIRALTATAAGSPIYDTSTSSTGGRTVSYPDKAWWSIGRNTLPDPSQKDPNRFGPPATPEQVRKQLADSTLKLIGHEVVNGRHTLHVRGEYDFHKPGVKPVGYNLWVDQKTYLPVRSIDTVTAVSGHFRTQVDYQWLAPTAANLAKLTNHVPAGFKRLPKAPEASGPGVG
jgi:hypothetical protein